MTTLTIEMPEEAFSALRRSPPEFGKDMRIAAATYWYQKGEISQEKAAQNQQIFFTHTAYRTSSSACVTAASFFSSKTVAIT